MDEAQWAGSDCTKLFQLIRSIGAVVRSIAGQLVGNADGRGGERGVGALEVVQSTAGRREGGTSTMIRKQSSVWMATALHSARHGLAADILTAPIEQPAWVCWAGRLILSDRYYSHRTNYILPHQAAVLA